MSSDFNHIDKRKEHYKVSDALEQYLEDYSRCSRLPIEYDDLLRYDSLVPICDKEGNPTLWNSVIFRPGEIDEIHNHLVAIYQELIADGSKIDYLIVDSVDFCSFGNSKPFRIKILNQINDNHDYYYIKKADASRIYGLELEHLFSPNKINYIYHKNTLIEEHIIGVPGDQFIEECDQNKRSVNEVRLSKEFIKFNERCFVRLLGDMRAYNFVIVVNEDFDKVQYRIRAIDFDQQSYEGRKNIYLPQFYKDNVFFVKLAQKVMSIETAEQYQVEEQSLLRKRYKIAKKQVDELIHIMKKDRLSTDDFVDQLKQELSSFYGKDTFLSCQSMGDILELNIKYRLNL